MDYPEERKQYIDGIACQYLCHIEKAEKPGNDCCWPAAGSVR